MPQSIPKIQRGQRHHQEPVLQDRQHHHGREQGVAGGAERIGAEARGALRQHHGADRRRGDGKRKQQVHRFVGQEAFDVIQMIRQEFRVQVRDAQKDIQAGAQMHPPQHDEGPGAELIRAAPRQADDGGGEQQDREFMIQAGLDRMAKMAPLERLGTPEDIAAVVAFLAGPDGSWINGQVLRANGGLI